MKRLSRRELFLELGMVIAIVIGFALMGGEIIVGHNSKLWSISCGIDLIIILLFAIALVKEK